MAKELGVRPLHDRILVRRMAEEERTAGGLFIPDTANEKRKISHCLPCKSRKG